MKKRTMQTLDLSYMKAVPVSVRQADELRLYLAGCGGTGSWLAPDIARLAVEFQHLWKQIHVTFIDPDTVERANIPRQNFCHAELGANKAEALAGRYGPAWGIEIAAIPQPLQPAMIADSWRGVSLIIGCVDNAAARKTIAETLKRNHTAQPSTWWLDCGNHTQSGQVLLGSTADPKTLAHAFDVPTFCTTLPSPALQHPELLKPLPEEVKGKRLSCAQIAAANYQALTVNKQVAAHAAAMLLQFITGELRYQKCELAFESPHVQTWDTRDKLLGLATLAYAFLLSLLAPDYQPLTRWLLDTWCPRNEKRSQSCLAPPYRLRLALARLWLTYPPPFLLILGSG